MIICDNCNKKLYPVVLGDKNPKNWCTCKEIGVIDGWSKQTTDIRKKRK